MKTLLKIRISVVRFYNLKYVQVLQSQCIPSQKLDVKNSSSALYIFFKLNISLRKKKKRSLLRKLLISRSVLIIDLKELVNRKVHPPSWRRDKLFFSLPSPLYLYFVNYERKLKRPILENRSAMKLVLYYRSSIMHR